MDFRVNPNDEKDISSIESGLEAADAQIRGGKDSRKKRPLGRPPIPGGPFEKHSILVPPDLWAWAQETHKGAAGLIRELLSKKRRAEQGFQVLHVPTEQGELVIYTHRKGITVNFEHMTILILTYNEEWGCFIANVPSRVTPLASRLPEASVKAAAKLSGAPLAPEGDTGG